MGGFVVNRHVMLLSLLALLAGCFFETRDPPPPELGGGCDFAFEFNDSWQNVLYNLEGALECGDAAEYMRVVSQTYIFDPSPLTAANYASVFATPWTPDREQIFVNDIFSSERYFAALTDSIVNEDDQGDLVIVTAVYTIQQVDSEGVPTGNLYTDLAEYRFQRTSGLVVLQGWRDTDGIQNARPFGERRGDQGGGV